jgi:hypothetical protein
MYYDGFFIAMFNNFGVYIETFQVMWNRSWFAQGSFKIKCTCKLIGRRETTKCQRQLKAGEMVIEWLNTLRILQEVDKDLDKAPKWKRKSSHGRFYEQSLIRW